MSNYNDEKLDKMLKSYCTLENETFTFSKPKKIKRTALIAACLVLVILAGIVFVPSLMPHKEHNFIIVANAQTLDEEGIASADEITRDAFVELENLCGNLVIFDFDEVLLEDAPYYDITKSFLFHSFKTNLNINVAGEDIKTVTYKFSDGSFVPVHIKDYNKFDNEDKEMHNHIISFSYELSRQEYTYNYDKNTTIHLGFNPVYTPDATYESAGRYFSSPYEYARFHKGYNCTESYVYSENEDELKAKFGWARTISGGLKSSAPTVVTEEEQETLREYARANDMIGFFNYQNQIFKRLVDGTTIDVTVTFTSGETVTKTLELIYTPKEVTNAEFYDENPTNTYSNGTISARLK
ncbi:MAG: hypothetical protein IKK10_04830 [Clostridia bacterium]|nr:hypothetical protein [Clostridia bacterium]